MTTADLAQLQARLDAAERVCLMFGWSPARHETPRDKAAHELWADWHNRYGRDAEERHRAHLSDEYIVALARKRDRTRARTLNRLMGVPES